MNWEFFFSNISLSNMYLKNGLWDLLNKNIFDKNIMYAHTFFLLPN